MPGPLPKSADKRRRRNRDGLQGGDLRSLPAAGRQGRVPSWPLTRATAREKALWTRIWKIPQAVAWEELGWFDAVARYVRVQATAEQPGAAFAALAEVRQLEDRLGLSPVALLRLRWQIVDLEPPEPNLEVLDIRQRLG